jgi:hypothetical protein
VGRSRGDSSDDVVARTDKDTMGRFGRITRATATLVLATIAVAGTLGARCCQRAATADPPTSSWSSTSPASILDDARTRTQFADAIDKIAVQVGQQSDQLTSSDATVSMIQVRFEGRRLPGLRQSEAPRQPRRRQEILRVSDVTGRRVPEGPGPSADGEGRSRHQLRRRDAAGRQVPARGRRPPRADPLHGRPARRQGRSLQARSNPSANRLFGNRSPFALLPVGMGLAPKDRPALEAGLKNLQITKDMPTCLGGTTKFAWPKVVFNTPNEAGTAVATALQDATCTFTVAPTPVPTPQPEPGPRPRDPGDRR